MAVSGKFASILSRRSGEAERPKPLPPGNYEFLITDYEFDESRRKKTPFVRFDCRPVSAHDDVEQDDLPTNWNEKTTRHTFYMTDDALYRLDEFLADVLGIELSGREYNETIPEAINQSFVGEITHSVPEGDNPPYANITSAVAV